MSTVTKIQVKDSTRVLARARAFSNENVKEHCFEVDASGVVRVFDPIAKHYTTCHCLSAKSQARIRRLAA